MKKIVATSFFLFVFLLAGRFVFADEFRSSSFKVLDSVIVPAGYGTSSGYQLWGTVSQIGIGTSSAAGFSLHGGFLSFPFVSTPAVSATPGNKEASLSWTASTGALGWTVSGYSIGRAASSSGPFIYTAVGNVTSNTMTGLTNLTKYYFVVRPQDAFGNPIASSSVVSAIPSTAQAAAETTLSFSSGGSHTLTNSDNTSAVFTIPANFYAENLELHSFSYPSSDFVASKPPPSGKNFAGKVYDFQFFTASSTQVSTLSAPVAITMSYTAADVSGIQENTLRPYRRESNDSAWSVVSGATVDAVNHRVTFSSASFSSFALIGDPISPTPAPSPPPPPPPPSGGGGGGGGGGGSYVAQAASVIFSGRAYPKSTVTLLKDAQISASTVAGSDANFQMTLSGLSAGNYNFAVYSEDKEGRRSSLLTFPVAVTAGATTNVGGIFIAPTVAVDKSEVKRGETIAIFGQSVPKADIIISVNSDEEFFAKTISDTGGVYLYNFDTALLETGSHTTKSKAAIGNQDVSSFSYSVNFKVGTKTVLAKQPTKAPAKGDLNGDGRVNLIDFSIAAYWYKRPLSAAFAVLEKEKLSGDGKVDLVDFSIMAYYWTG